MYNKLLKYTFTHYMNDNLFPPCIQYAANPTFSNGANRSIQSFLLERDFTETCDYCDM